MHLQQTTSCLTGSVTSCMILLLPTFPTPSQATFPAMHSAPNILAFFSFLEHMCSTWGSSHIQPCYLKSSSTSYLTIPAYPCKAQLKVIASETPFLSTCSEVVVLTSLCYYLGENWLIFFFRVCITTFTYIFIGTFTYLIALSFTKPQGQYWHTREKAQCLAQSKYSINIYWMNESILFG